MFELFQHEQAYRNYSVKSSDLPLWIDLFSKTITYRVAKKNESDEEVEG